mmetsp:Transcript_235/g.514  ORF Transcript_235/g.514 Transcript_235/m.514 type:complete len:182 (+) Transcript_235:1316-1861(+)
MLAQTALPNTRLNVMLLPVLDDGTNARVQNECTASPVSKAPTAHSISCDHLATNLAKDFCRWNESAFRQSSDLNRMNIKMSRIDRVALVSEEANLESGPSPETDIEIRSEKVHIIEMVSLSNNGPRISRAITAPPYSRDENQGGGCCESKSSNSDRVVVVDTPPSPELFMTLTTLPRIDAA